jgi:hypothetical protein
LVLAALEALVPVPQVMMVGTQFLLHMPRPTVEKGQLVLKLVLLEVVLLVET